MKIIGAFNRNQIENTIKPRESRKSVLISITAPSNEHPEPRAGYDDILQLSFKDEEAYGDADNLMAMDVHNLMTMDDARKIIDFALTHVDKDIFVSCDAGLSRSPAVVIALEELFNSNDVKDRYPLYNQFVYKRIKDRYFLRVWFNE